MKLITLSAQIAIALTAVVGSGASAGVAPSQEGAVFDSSAQCLMDSGASGLEVPAALVEQCGYDPNMSIDEFTARWARLIDREPVPVVVVMQPARDQFTDYEFSFFERFDNFVETSKDLVEFEQRAASLEREASANLDAESPTGATIIAGLNVAQHASRFARANTQTPQAKVRSVDPRPFLTPAKQMKLLLLTADARWNWGTAENAAAGYKLGLEWLLAQPNL